MLFLCVHEQVMRRCILEMILESEKNYLEALKRILEVFAILSVLPLLLFAAVENLFFKCIII